MRACMCIVITAGIIIIIQHHNGARTVYHYYSYSYSTVCNYKVLSLPLVIEHIIQVNLLECLQ